MINSRYIDAKGLRGIFIPVLILTFVGIIMVYSSTALLSAGRYGSGFHFLWKHIFTVCIGTGAMLLLANMDYQRLRPLGVVLLIVSFVLLILVFVPGIGLSANGARRWIRLWPTTFQPSELSKLAMVLFLADYMAKNSHRMKGLLHGIVVPVGIMLFFQGIILLQPDFGGVMSLGILTVGLLFLGGARLIHLASLIFLAIPPVYFLLASSAYRWKRITCFVDPWRDAFGCGFQLVQSFIAFGNGSLTGLGIGGSKQKLFFLPEAHTDFILPLIGEELGFIGVMAVVGLFIWLIAKGIMVAMDTDDHFSYYLAFGLTMMIASQVVINFAVSTGLMPTKGLPLPFISYGGSALLINMAAIGILLNIAIRNDKRKLERRARSDITSAPAPERRGR